MDVDDSRHGSEAGYEQHLRDGEEPCDDCVEGDLKAGRRRSKRINQGYVYTTPLGPKLVAKLARARIQGATYEQIADRAGLAVSQVFTFCKADPEYVVYARTYQALIAMHEGPYLTPIGITRRLQGLAALGYSAPVIASHCGVHRDTIADATHGPRDFLAGKVSTAIVELYERLSMQLPPSETQHQRASVSRIRRMAERRGYHPPLAWDDGAIDDVNATPHVGGDKYDHSTIDHAVVTRVLAGEVLPTTQAERFAIMRRWLADGRSAVSLCNRMGWRQGRYGDGQKEAS